ncbi:aminotransferase class V-fold PLP-dependent enzyme [uncultured Kordia sp.]|uniref:aminotransferase class V-fold PLP-dependent enzyme n=1 Tax=uncultured Kordia sp. TaxID=507699 RepID=UPI0026381D07|nr:aminotransferase class V-fold PLP-dependent enzyme [uncultured Kordia sp.]
METTTNIEIIENLIHGNTKELPLDFKKVFDTNLFEKHSDIIVDKLEAYLLESQQTPKGIDLRKPEELLEEIQDLMNSESSNTEDTLKSIIDLYLQTGVQANSPGYMGRQFSSVFPLASVFDFISSMLTQPSSFYEAAQLPSVVRVYMAKELNKYINYPEDEFDMVTTSGGSLANLTALLSARNYYFPEFWEQGILSIKENEIPAIAVSEEAHYSIIRTVEMLGFHKDQIVKLPVNQKRQVDIKKVQPALDQAKKEGFKVFCIVANAATTAVGAFDPIDDLAAAAEKNDCWLHIDGAHGASFLLSEKHRGKLKGIEKADSITWDAHKMMFIPGTCSMLFYKDKRRSKLAFRQNASYVFEKEEDQYTKYDGAKKNIECTKRPMIMNLWGIWMFYGPEVFQQKIDHLCDLGRKAYNVLKANSHFQSLHEPEANMLCFRYKPKGFDSSKLKDFQLQIRNQIKANGNFFISKVNIDGEPALRVVFMNHRIQIDHFKMLLAEIQQIGNRILNPNTKAMDVHNHISIKNTPINGAASIQKKTKKNSNSKASKAAAFAKKIIPDTEFSPKSIDDVKKQPMFYEKIKMVEAEKGTNFYKVDFDTQDALVLRRLQQMVNNLFLNPFWKNRLETAGITETPIDFEAWQNIPLTDKETMTTAFNGKREGMVVPFSDGGFEIVASGGTTSGIPLETVYELQELQDTYKIAGEFMGKFIADKYFKKKTPKWIITTLADTQMWSSGTMVGGVLQKIPNTNFLGAGPLNLSVYDHMMSYKGDKLIMSISSAIAALADYGKEMSEEKRASFQLAMYGSGLMSQQQETALKEVYPNVKLLSYFAATQAETIGLQLDHKSKTLSAVPGLHFIEIVDENGKWVKEGEEGELVVTRLHSNKVPNVRYKLGDRAIRLKRKNTKTLRTDQFLFQGRSGDIIHITDSHFSTIKVMNALFAELDKIGVEISKQALEIQFLNDRANCKLTLLVSTETPKKLYEMVQQHSKEKIDELFVNSLVQSLPIFNAWESNVAYIKKSKYEFELKVVDKGSDAIFRTPLGKTPLIKDQF